MSIDVLRQILQGASITLLLTGAALLIGAVGGIPLALLRQAPWRPLRILTRVVIDLIRGIPAIVWLFIIAFGLGPYLQNMDPLAAAIVGLGVISSAYLAEIYRGGLAAIHKGQWEASAALGMSRIDTVSRIVGPQIVRVSIPAAATYGIGLLKDSSAAFALCRPHRRHPHRAHGAFPRVRPDHFLLHRLQRWVGHLRRRRPAHGDRAHQQQRRPRHSCLLRDPRCPCNGVLHDLSRGDLQQP